MPPQRVNAERNPAVRKSVTPRIPFGSVSIWPVRIDQVCQFSHATTSPRCTVECMGCGP